MRCSIDPGTTHSAYLFMRSNGSIADFHEACPNADLVSMIASREMHELIIEEIRSYGMAIGKSTLDTVRWIGHFECTAIRRQLPVHLVGRLEVKIHWCKSAKAKDANVRQALIDHYGAPGTKKYPGPTYGIASHMWACLAIAGYWDQTHPIRTMKATCHADENPEAYLRG